MSKKLFYEYLDWGEIRPPVDETCLIDIIDFDVDLNFELPPEFKGDKIKHIIYNTSDPDSRFAAVEEHNARVDKWNNKHPDCEMFIINPYEDTLHPNSISNKLIYNTKIFFLLRSKGAQQTAEQINRTALDYYRTKLLLAKKYNANEKTLEYHSSVVDDIISWFINQAIDIDKVEAIYPDYSNPPDITVKELSPYQLEELSNTERAEYFVSKAREDSTKNSHLSWKSKMMEEFGKDIYVYLNRIRGEFKNNNPEERFNINGLSWYKKY